MLFFGLNCNLQTIGTWFAANCCLRHFMTFESFSFTQYSSSRLPTKGSFGLSCARNMLSSSFHIHEPFDLDDCLVLLGFPGESGALSIYWYGDIFASPNKSQHFTVAETRFLSMCQCLQLITDPHWLSHVLYPMLSWFFILKFYKW